MAYTASWTQDLYSHVTETEISALLDEIPHATVFLDWPWMSSCFEHLPDHSRPWILILRDDQHRLRACLPLQLSIASKYGITYQLLRWLQYPFADRVLPLVAAEGDVIRLAVINALAQAPFTWDVMIWNEMPHQGELLREWRDAARQSRLALYMEKKSVCPVMTLECRDATAIENSLSKSARQRVKRARKRLLQEKNVQILHDRPGPEQVLTRLEEFKVVENESWKGEEGVGIFSDDASWRFFQTLSSRLAARGQLDLAEIRIDGRLASYRFGMFFRGVFLDYNLAYRPEYHKLGLGRILLDELVTDCARQQYRAIDGSRVGRNSQHLLFERADSFVEHWQMSWYGTSTKAFFMRFLQEVLVKHAKQMRQRWSNWKESRASNASPSTHVQDSDQTG